MSDRCPNGCNLTGEPIPQKYLDNGWYGIHTHYSRKVGIYDLDRDRTVEWMCPDCGIRWPRG